MNDDWEYIGGWEDTGIITSSILRKWAFSENGYLKHQDEDLMMYRPELIVEMHRLMLAEGCIRKLDLLKTLKGYAFEAYKKTTNQHAISEFEKLSNLDLDNQMHNELINYLLELKRN